MHKCAYVIGILLIEVESYLELSIMCKLWHVDTQTNSVNNDKGVQMAEIMLY